MLDSGSLMAAVLALGLGGVLVWAARSDSKPPRRHDIPRTPTPRERELAWHRRRARHRVECARRAAAATELAHARTEALRSEFHNTCTVIGLKS
jgi:hypothetical protein